MYGLYTTNCRIALKSELKRGSQAWTQCSTTTMTPIQAWQVVCHRW